MIELKLLGTAAMTPLPTRWLSSLLVRVNGSLMLIDCGEGTQISMREHGWGFRKLDVVVFTHFHADHTLGFPGLLFSLANSNRTDPLHVYGPQHTGTLIEYFGAMVPGLPFQVVAHDIEPGSDVSLPNGLTARAALGEHRGDVYAWRFELPRTAQFDPEAAQQLGVPRTMWSTLQRGQPIQLGEKQIRPHEVHKAPRSGVSFGYTTDTRPVPAVRELVTGVDLLVTEATYPTDEFADMAVATGHMTFPEAARLARDARVGHAWLTHFSARITDPEDYLEAARAIFPELDAGYAGLHGEIRFANGYRVVDTVYNRTINRSMS